MSYLFGGTPFDGYDAGGRRSINSGGGGGGGQQTSTGTTYNTNIPEYARPYVETMLGSAQKQIYTMDDSGNVTGFKPYTPYSTDVNQYFAGPSPMQEQAYTAAANMQVPGQYGVATGIAGQAAMQGLGAGQTAAGLQRESLGYGAAGAQYGDVGQMYGAQGAQQANLAAQQAARQAQMYGRQGAMTGQQALGYGAQGAGYGAGATALGADVTQLAQQQGMGYGALGAGYGAEAAYLSPQATAAGQAMANIGAAGAAGAGALGSEVSGRALGYGQASAESGQTGLATGRAMADIGAQGIGYGLQGAGYGARSAQAAEQGYGAGTQFAQQATSPEATAAYMSPYMQNVVDYQKTQALRDYSIGQQLRKAQAVGAGAFGGSRQAILESEAQRNLMSQLGGIEAQGAQQAFQNAQAQQQFGANLGVQGLQAGTAAQQAAMQGSQTGLSGLGMALQGQQGQLSGLAAYQQGLQGAQQGLGQALAGGQLGLSGTQQALAGQQGVLSSLGQAGQLYGLGMQGAGVGLSGLQGALAGSAQGLQGYQTGIQGAQAGMQGVSGAQAGYNLGLQGVGQQLSAGQLGLQGTAQGIQGAQAGMQGAQTGLQGINAATQAGQYGLSGTGAATQAATTLGQLGTSDLAAQTNIANLQSQYGAQQQALEQQKINQAIQNYATEQQYPYMQLGILNSLLRGLPLQSTTVESYQATPSIGQQAAGLGISGLGAYKTLSGFKEGGTVKGLAVGGPSEVENSIRAKLEAMTPQQLQQVAKTSQSPEIRAMAQEVLAEHTQRDRAEQQARQAIAQEQAAKPQMPQEAPAGLAAAPAPNFDSMAAGGIVAFADGGDAEEEDPFAGIENKQLREVALGQEQLRRAYGYKDGAYDQYKKFLEEKQAGLANEREGVIGMGLMDLGSRIATTPGPYGAALGQSIQGALPGFQKGVAEFKKAKADVYKAQADVAKAENDLALGRADKTQAAYAALRKEENDLKRTQMQIEGNIRAAGVSANRATDLDKTTEAFLADRLAKGEPDNARTRAAARSDALAATGFAGAKVITGQEQAVTTALDKDDQLTGLNKRLNMLQITPKQAQKNATEIESLKKQIAAREQEVRNRVLRQEQPEAPAGGADVVDFNQLKRRG